MSTNPQIDVRKTLGTALGQELADLAARVRRAETQLGRAPFESSRLERVAAATRTARRSPTDALKAPVRILRALRAPKTKPVTRTLAGATARVRLVPRSSTAVPATDQTPQALAQRSARLSEALRSGRRLVVAGSLDERTRLGLTAECELIDLRPGAWRQVVSDAIDLVLLEPLRRKPGVRAEVALSGDIDEITALVDWCHDHDIPTALWNTCDPFDHSFTLPVAKLVDHVFTTDLESVPYYVGRLGHNRIHVCPVGTQPLLYNPMGRTGHERAAVFAGGYEASCTPRTNDLATVIEGAARVLPVKIYDRNLHARSDQNAHWPDQYSSLIMGRLSPDEVSNAYRDSKVGLNASTTRSSSSALPRRVFDLLASGTPVISSYSRGIRVLLGDLVPMSDHPDGVERLLSELLADQEALDKRRAVGLRRVMAEHTYRERLAHIAYTVAGSARPARDRRVGVVAAVATPSEAVRVAKLVATQEGVDAQLVLVSNPAVVNVTHTTLITPERAVELTLGEALPGVRAIAVLDPDDWYGPHYLSGLLDGLEYSDGQATTKQVHYRAAEGQVIAVSRGAEYTWVTEEPVSWARSLVSSPSTSATKLIDALMPHAPIPKGLRVLAVDRFDYCEQGSDQAHLADLSAELAIDTGWPVHSLTDEKERIVQLMLNPPATTEVDPASFPTGSFQTAGRGRLFAARTGAGHLLAFTTSDPDTPWYRSLEGAIPVDQLVTPTTRTAYLQVQAKTRGGRFGVNVAFNDADGNRLPGKTYGPGQAHAIAIPDDAVSIRLKFSMKGAGSALVKSVALSKANPAKDRIPHLAGRSTRTLLLTDFYASYEVPYHRGFIHSRVQSYQQYGVPVDVWVNNSSLGGIAHREFDGVDVAMGPSWALREVLQSGGYDTVLVHTMYEHIWRTLRDYVEHLRIVAWMHGGELHRWWLDKQNPTISAPRALQIEQIRADPRFKHWASVLASTHPNQRFIFVSQTYLNQANEDLSLLGVQFPPEQTVVIPNPVNTGRFAYTPKPPAHRKRLMALRPYWTTTYANDLTVAAIVDLSTEPWFNELDILIAGDGHMFDETTVPLTRFSNVKLDKRFFTQTEIATLHRHYGVALVPSRADTQGLSRDEAMSSGLVTVNTAIDAIPEFVSGDEGYLVPPEDPKAIADAVRDLYHHPERFLAKSAAAAARIRRTVADEIVIPREVATFTKRNTATG